MNVASLSNVWKRSCNSHSAAVMGILAAILATGCGGVPKTSFYTLQVPAVPAASATKMPYLVGVEHFRSPEILRDDRVMYYVSATEINFYQHHRWGAEPATMLAEFTAQWLQSTGAFEQVKMFPLREKADYTLGGDVTDFEELDETGAVKVRLALALNLVRNSDRKLVWTGQQRVETPLQGTGVDGVASALNSACAQALQAMVPGLIERAEEDFKNSGK
jgi:ABC-type uncharacterized transport system auxiliary subunit